MKKMKCRNCKRHINSIHDVNVCEVGTMQYEVRKREFDGLIFDYKNFEGNGEMMIFCNYCGVEVNIADKEKFLLKLLENEGAR